MKINHKTNYGTSRELWQELAQKELTNEEIAQVFQRKIEKGTHY